MTDHGALSPDEWREKEGVNPVPDDAGKVYFYPVNMQKLWSANADPDMDGASETPAEDAAEDAGTPGDDTSDTDPGADDVESEGDSVGEEGADS